MELNEDLFEDGNINNTSIEDKFKYLKEYEVYKDSGHYNYTRPCKAWDLNLTDKQLEAFDEFLNNDMLGSFWDANEELSHGIFQAGRMGGHLVLSTKLADPQMVKYNHDYIDFENDHLAKYYDIEYDENDDVDPECIEENHQECAELINDAYNNLIDFDNRVDQLIELLKQELDSMSEHSEEEINDDSNFTESVTDEEKCCICGGPLGKYGNNAQPVKSGRCCDKCNYEVVLPARLGLIRSSDKTSSDDSKLNESKTRFSEINSDLSQEIFNVVLPKKVTGDELVDYMYQFNDGLKAGINKMELLVALKDAKSPDDFGRYIYNNSDPDKYRKIYNESYKVVDEDGNKVAQGGGFKSKEEAEMFAAQYGKKGLKVVKESFDDEDDRDKMPYFVYMIEADDKIVGENLTRREAKELTKKLKDTVKEYIYVTNVEYYERDGHSQKDYNDVVDAYKKDGKWVVNLDPFHWLDDGMKSIYDESLTEIGTNQFGDKQYKYKGYTICYFPYDMEYDDKTDHFESYIIESPAVLSNGYHLPLHCEDENGEVINFLSLEAAKKWIDVFDGEFKLEVKNGNEIHAVIKSQAIKESFEDEHGVAGVEIKAEPAEIPAQNPSSEDNGLVAIVNGLIQSEWNSVQSYKDAIVNFANQNRNDLTATLEDILNEENIHVGQLETLLKSLDSSAENIEQGKQEAEEQIEINKGDNI